MSEELREPEGVEPQGDDVEPPQARAEKTGGVAEEPAPEAAGAVRPEEVAALREELERYRQEAERNWQQFLHAAADLENYKKAAARMQRDAVERTRRQMLLVVLSAVDDLERAIGYAERSADHELVAGILEGLRMTHRSLLEHLRSLGVERMEAVGEPFDPGRHEAVEVASAEEAGVEPGTVLGVIQPGYVLDGRVLRPARVRVAQ
ncbi:MAG: nucleotide exchange factor GrpE [Armatimonadota bacterium]|nr:nucleotide exchange factor GrpE [Armatimonadota bacterium]MDR7590986.1 nucleotide exchange factor GrpE [Armatimonadota bacterium]MDR7594245.1 nucleotide exchange factor GrpE [Armatimonadota bacterium]